MVRKISRGRATVLAETLRTCLDLFSHVWAGQAMLSQCYRGFSAQQHNSLGNQTAAHCMVRNLFFRGNLPWSLQTLSGEPTSKTRSASHFLQALVLLAPMGAAHPFGKEWETGGQEPCWRPLPKVCKGAGFVGL